MIINNVSTSGRKPRVLVERRRCSLGSGAGPGASCVLLSWRDGRAGSQGERPRTPPVLLPGKPRLKPSQMRLQAARTLLTVCVPAGALGSGCPTSCADLVCRSGGQGRPQGEGRRDLAQTPRVRLLARCTPSTVGSETRTDPSPPGPVGQGQRGAVLQPWPSIPRLRKAPPVCGAGRSGWGGLTCPAARGTCACSKPPGRRTPSPSAPPPPPGSRAPWSLQGEEPQVRPSAGWTVPGICPRGLSHGLGRSSRQPAPGHLVAAAAQGSAGFETRLCHLKAA